MSINKSSFAAAGRRDFLKTVAKAGLSTNLLRGSSLATGMMLSRASQAMAEPGVINKVICVYIPGGTPFSGGQSLFTPSSNLVLPAASRAMEPIKNDCIFFSDASVTGGGGHGTTSKTLGGTVHNDTYDVALERTLGANSPFPSLLLGVQSTEGNHGYATKKDNREVAYQDNPVASFNRVFSGNVSVGSIESKRSQTVLDTHKAEIAELQKVLGSAEKARLDEHLASINKLEERLIAQASQSLPAGCSSPTSWNSGNFQYNASDKTTFTAVSALQMDLAVLALRCNYTKVVSIMLGNHQSEHSVPELSWNGAYHQSIHGGSAQDHAVTRNYLAGRLTDLIQKLKTAKDEFGDSMLDTTLVVQVTDMGNGNAHNSVNAPMVLAGGGAKIKRGQVARCGGHVNIFETMTEALGLTGRVAKYGNSLGSSIIV